MEKYYIPSIEELYIGFEYEWSDPKRNMDWKTLVIKDIHDLTDVIDYLEWEKKGETTEKHRVKYLDKEDIESLGWKFMGTVSKDEGNTVNSIFTKGEFTIYFYGPMLQIFLNTPISEVFRGEIRNKSELKKLMKQLNIL